MRLSSGAEYMHDRLAILEKAGFSISFRAIIRYAFEMKCRGIRFDCDGETIERFRTYNW
jgi:hypothetical protein